MNLKLLIAFCCLMLAVPVLAQTNTPTPSPTPTPGFALPSFGSIPSPTPVATSNPVVIEATIEIQSGPIYNYLATVEHNLSAAPADITNPGLPVVPSETGIQLFGYIKWLISSGTGDQLLGPFGSMTPHFAAYITLVVFLATIYFLVFVVRFLLRFVVWVITQILKLIP
jgi:hypothetical protein